MKPTDIWDKLSGLLGRRRAQAVEPISEDVTKTSYYHEKSVVYATAQMVILLVLAVFLAVSFLSGSGRMSVENWTLFISDLSGAVVLPETGSSETVVFGADESNQFVSYRGGLSLLGRERLTVFTATGRENYTVSLGYHTPRLCSSGRYLLAWDLGGNRLSAYHSFSKLFDTVTDSPIRYVAVSEKGYFCVLTDDDVYPSLVTLYDGDFDVVSRIHLREYAVCAAIADDGAQMAVASVSSDQGRMQLSLLLSVPGKEEPVATVTLPDEYPLALCYTEQALQLLCRDRVYRIGVNGEILSEYTFSADRLQDATLSTEGCTLLLRANRYDYACRVLALDAAGQPLYDITTDTDVLDAVLDEDGSLYLLQQGVLSAYHDGESEAADVLALKEHYKSLLPIGGGEVFLCGEAKAVCVQVE